MARYLVTGKDATDRCGVRTHLLFYTQDSCDIVADEKEAIKQLEKGGYAGLLYAGSKPTYRLAEKHASQIRLFAPPDEYKSNWNIDKRISKFFYKLGLRAIVLSPARLLLLVVCWCLKAFGRHVMLAIMSAQRIGHNAYNTHVLLTKAGAYKRPLLFIVYCKGPVANKQLMAMYKRIATLSVISQWLYNLFDCSLLRKSRFFFDTTYYGDVHEPLHTLDKKHDKVYLHFTAKEQRIGQQLLNDMGVPGGAAFVCIHARDSRYLDKTYPRKDDSGWRYHNFRDGDIETYREAAEYLTQQGLYVIRMGAIVDKPFPPQGNDHIIDYATEYRTDFMDVYLLSKCKFLLGSCCGVTQVATVFGRPVAIANWTHIEFSTCFRFGDIILPKLTVSATGDVMPLRQILASGAGRFTETEQYKKADITLVDNTPEQIKALAVEMNDMIDSGGFTEAQLAKNQQFKSIMHNRNYVCDGTKVSLSSEFMAQYPEWLV